MYFLYSSFQSYHIFFSQNGDHQSVSYPPVWRDRLERRRSRKIPLSARARQNKRQTRRLSIPVDRIRRQDPGLRKVDRSCRSISWDSLEISGLHIVRKGWSASETEGCRQSSLTSRLSNTRCWVPFFLTILKTPSFAFQRRCHGVDT